MGGNVLIVGDTGSGIGGNVISDGSSASSNVVGDGNVARGRISGVD